MTLTEWLIFSEYNPSTETINFGQAGKQWKSERGHKEQFGSNPELFYLKSCTVAKPDFITTEEKDPALCPQQDYCSITV